MARGTSALSPAGEAPSGARSTSNRPGLLAGARPGLAVPMEYSRGPFVWLWVEDQMACHD